MKKAIQKYNKENYKVQTLIEKNGAPIRWYPNSIDNYKTSIKIPNTTSDYKRMISNFAYSMQYIEYIEKQIDELKLSSVLLKMLYKSYIITGMGIIELIFVYLLKENKFWKQTEWEEYAEIKANPKEIDGEIVMMETRLYKKVPKYDMRMDLDSMIKSIEKKGILTINHDVFPALKQLRELRNRVHLQLGETAYDHDFNCIGLEDLQMMRRILFTILTAPEICNDSNTFQFINTYYTKNL